MTRRRPRRCRALLVLFAVTLPIPVLPAQRADADQTKFAAATLPESNEALLLSSRIEDAIQAGDYRLAVELIDRLMDLSAGLVAAPASRTYYPVWRQAFRLLARLPPAGVELYRQLYDAEVAARFQKAASEADVGVLRELFHGYRLSTSWPAIGVELAAHLLDQGAYGEAIEVLREMTSADRLQTGSTVGIAPEYRAQLVVALASAGAIRPARRLLAELQSDAELGAQPGRRERLEQLERWFATLRADGPGLSARVRDAISPCIDRGVVWRRSLHLEGGARRVDEGDDIAEAVDVLRRLPLQQPVLTAGEGGAADGGLVVRMHGRIWVFDSDTLLPRWSAAERVPGGPSGMAAVAGRGDDARLSSEAELLMSNHLRHVVSVGFGKVYAVEGLTFFDASFDVFGRRPFPAGRAGRRPNELVARALNSGRIEWRTRANAADSLYDVTFQNVPLVVGETLVAPIQRGDDLALVVLDPVDGKLLREVPLVGPPTHFTGTGGRCLIVSDATTLYICTGNGVIAALAREDLSWKWATVYPSTLSEHLGQLWWQPTETTAEPNVDQPVIADDLLIVAPVDSTEMFALDRFDGRERWRMSRREWPYLIGALRSGGEYNSGSAVERTSGTQLVVGGRCVACLDLNDPAGREPRWKSVPLQITGRATIREGRIFVPTRAGIVVLDGRSGKVLADQIVAIDLRAGRTDRLKTVPTADEAAGASDDRVVALDRTANLLVSNDTLFSVSPSRVVKYPDLRRVRVRYAALADEQVGGDGDVLVRAWLDALEGRYEKAFTRLQASGFTDRRPAGAPAATFVDSQLIAARDQLLTYVFLGLARDASAGEDRLGWLQRASALADSPESAARLAITIGRALEGSGQWAAALRHYGDLLYQPDVCQVADRSDAGRRLAGWLHAAERIIDAYARSPAGFAEELVGQALSGNDRRAINLQRLRVALMNEPQRERVDQLLSLQKLAPELKVRYLPKGDLETLPVEMRRRVQLERWDTHVSLGDLERARADREVWEEKFANSPAPDATKTLLVHFEPLSVEDERDRARAIDLASRKLAQVGGQPFTRHVARQWKIERAELLLDPRRPLTGVRPWLLITNLDQHRIELINAFKHQHPQRQTEDGMLAERERLAGAPGITPARRFEWEGGQRGTWPVVTHQQLAAIPVRGGLICVGLGPERYAGRRQWEYAVPEWGAVPAGFADRSVAGPGGVFFCPRRDRVVLVGWFDGQLRWQRDLPGVTIERLYLMKAAATDRQLVIVGDNQRIWVTDAAYGRNLRCIETGIATPRRVDVVGETIVVWGLDSAAGIGAGTFQQLWSKAYPPIVDTVVVVEAARVEVRGPAGRAPPWIAYRAHGELEWHLLDVVRGEPVFEASLGEFDALTAIVADSERLYVAGRVGHPEDEGELRTVRVRAFDPADGKRLWSRDFSTTVAVNPTQLAAHPDMIPILLAGVGGVASREADLPAIQLVNKRDGELGEPLSIKADYRPVVEATCEMYMLATPTRMIVQAGGNLIAYGNSPLRSGP